MKTFDEWYAKMSGSDDAPITKAAMRATWDAAVIAALDDSNSYDQAEWAGAEGALVRRHRLTDTRWTVTDMSSPESNYGMCLVHIPYVAPGAAGFLLLLHRGPGGWHWEARKGGYWVHQGHCADEGPAMTAALREVRS